jgi:hypothetical protein
MRKLTRALSARRGTDLIVKLDQRKATLMPMKRPAVNAKLEVSAATLIVQTEPEQQRRSTKNYL